MPLSMDRKYSGLRYSGITGMLNQLRNYAEKDPGSLGHITTAEGGQSVAMGFKTTATGTRSVALGDHTTAATDRSLSIGTFNQANTSADNTLFVAGNGSDSPEALVLDFDGNVTIAGSLTENTDRRLKRVIEPWDQKCLKS